MTEENPYQPPAVKVTDPVSDNQGELVKPKKCPAGKGLGWIVQAFGLFKSNPAIWIVNIVIMFLIFLVLALIPVIGSIAAYLLMPVFMGGIMLGCAAQSRGEEFTVGHLFAGFQKNTETLVVVGILFLLGMLLLSLITFGTILVFAGGGEAMSELTSPVAMAPSADLFLAIGGVAILLVIALSLPLFMAYFFAPALVVFHDLKAIEAMKMSFRGCLRNILPFLVYGVIGLVLAVLATIPFGLGWLVLAPITFAVVYVSYLLSSPYERDQRELLFF